MSSTHQTDKLSVPTPGTLITARDGYYFLVLTVAEPSPDDAPKLFGWDGQWITVLMSEKGVNRGWPTVMHRWCLVSTFKHLVSSGQWSARAPDEGND